MKQFLLFFLMQFLFMAASHGDDNDNVHTVYSACNGSVVCNIRSGSDNSSGLGNFNGLESQGSPSGSVAPVDFSRQLGEDSQGLVNVRTGDSKTPASSSTNNSPSQSNTNTGKNNSAAEGDSAAETAGTPTSEGSGGFNNCQVQAQALINACSTSKDSAVSNCDTNNNSSLTSAMGAASQITSSMSSSAPSASGACSNMGLIGASAQSALAAYQMTCSNAKSSCLNKCEQARKNMSECAAKSGMSLASLESSEGFREATNNYSLCQAQQAKVDQAGAALSNIMAETQKAKECQAQLAAMNTPSNDPNSAYCKAHPTVASCILDCNHPTMATNQTCICVKNPFDASCGGTSASNKAGSFESLGGGTTTNNSKDTPNLSGGDGFDLDALNKFASESRRGMGGDGEDPGGRQGAGANLGSSTPDSGGGSSGRGGGGYADPKGVAVNSGFYGSGGGAGGGSSGGSGSGGSGGYAGSAGVGGSRGPVTPDLRQFLPGGRMDPSRGVAGLAGSDGISGPNETNWTKMQRRYRFLEGTFLP